MDEILAQEYREFRDKVGKLTYPVTAEMKTKLLESQNSIHFVISEFNFGAMRQFLYVLDLLEMRSAVREVDYIVCADMDDVAHKLRLAVHTTYAFLCDEDFDMGIPRYNTRK